MLYSKRMDASKWDNILNMDKGDPYRRLVMVPMILGLLPDIRNKKVLDVGTGNGFLIPYLLPKGPKLVVGIDKSKELLELASERLPKEVLLYERDILTCDEIPNAPFDIAICNFVINEIRDIELAYKKIVMQLAEDALLIAGILHPAYVLGKSLIDGTRTLRNFKDYFSEREIFEIYVDEKGNSMKVPNYFSKISSHLNAVTGAGFSIVRTAEPRTPEEVVSENPSYFKPYRNLPISLYMLLRLNDRKC